MAARCRHLRPPLLTGRAPRVLLSVCLSVCYTHKEQMNAMGPAVVQQLER